METEVLLAAAGGLETIFRLLLLAAVVGLVRLAAQATHGRQRLAQVHLT
jgi:hypothetical protein